MGLFGLFKHAGDAVSARLSEWMGGDYIKTAAVSGMLLFLEEFASNLVVNLLKLAGGKAVAVKTAGRVGLSAMYYYGIKDKTIAVASSIAPISLAFAELFAYLIGGSPAQTASVVAGMIRRALGKGTAPAYTPTYAQLQVLPSASIVTLGAPQSPPPPAAEKQEEKPQAAEKRPGILISMD